MQLNKPATVGQFENPRGLDINTEPITIKSGLVLGIGSV
jgi:hypothetical protein